MTLVFGVPLSVLFGQLLLGLINGSFYALLSLGLAIIFGLLRIINFAHGAQYMLGAFAAFIGLNYLGINYWMALLLSPLLIGLLGMGIERGLLRRIAGEDHLYGLLLTFGLALIVEGSFVKLFGVSGSPYPMPDLLKGGHNLGLHVPANLSCLGHRRCADGVLCDLVHDRADPAWLLSARRDGESQVDAGIRHQRPAAGHPDVWLWRCAGRIRRRACRAHLRCHAWEWAPIY
jgi:hypothetical protein